MDAKRNRNKMFADTNESGYVWTGLTVHKPTFQHYCLVSSSEVIIIKMRFLTVHNPTFQHFCLVSSLL